ncbi:molybdate ABC transporter substrate-binding protein [Isoptericola sp. NEAU-Y5]|uniref:Molybdate ABC transporter substrate-binding protein n=1 Tax=Isoptericola luteus TaxID=2879484 RepID=A0ABS7ZNL6_9MICO|nr:molybdate ABC transporter substrate-binding protein [Isoptericola sp. NEAU-Y5]MCA5895224.1 molybdate ABC transporter substrate-binding protein [Isoptericola sp. NEAU-Y5]
MRRRPRTPAAGAGLAGLALAATALGGCGPAAGGDVGTSAGTTTLTVFAAASLQHAFEQVATEFEARHEGVDVRLSLAGSADLVAQVQQGAPADVVATASTATMDRLAADNLVGAPQAFATNALQIAVPPGNPAGVETLADLTDPGLALVLCAPEVPCGAASAAVEEAAGLHLRPVSEERSVTDVLGKVTTGEADAGLVYVTDVAAAGDGVEGIAFPESSAAPTTYPVATVAGSAEPALAQEFVHLVLAAEGRATLLNLGFGAP